MTSRKQLSVRNLSIMFGGVHAVEDVSFDVEPGETFAIIGPNGAGKSTIFNLISRLYEPTAGSIHYGEHDLLKMPAHKVVRTGIGRTFQNIELFEQATVLQNLLVGRHSHMQPNPFTSFAFPARRSKERDRAPAQGRRHHRPDGDSRSTATSEFPICPTVPARMSSWRARFAPNRLCCCWTSPPPG